MLLRVTCGFVLRCSWLICAMYQRRCYRRCVLGVVFWCTHLCVLYGYVRGSRSPSALRCSMQHAGTTLGLHPLVFGQNGAFQQRMPGKLWDMHYGLSSALCLCGPCLCVPAAAATAGVSHFSPTRVSSCAVVRQSDSLRMLLACITHTWCSFWCALHDRAPSVEWSLVPCTAVPSVCLVCHWVGHAQGEVCS